jgi:hypothetical protein
MRKRLQAIGSEKRNSPSLLGFPEPIGSYRKCLGRVLPGRFIRATYCGGQEVPLWRDGLIGGLIVAGIALAWWPF